MDSTQSLDIETLTVFLQGRRDFAAHLTRSIAATRGRLTQLANKGQENTASWDRTQAALRERMRTLRATRVEILKAEQKLRAMQNSEEGAEEAQAESVTSVEASAPEIAWQHNPATGDLVTYLPSGSKVIAYPLDDPSGIWGEGYGYIATIPGTKRGVSSKGRIASLGEVLVDAEARVSKAIRPSSKGASDLRLRDRIPAHAQKSASGTIAA